MSVSNVVKLPDPERLRMFEWLLRKSLTLGSDMLSLDKMIRPNPDQISIKELAHASGLSRSRILALESRGRLGNRGFINGMISFSAKTIVEISISKLKINQRRFIISKGNNPYMRTGTIGLCYALFLKVPARPFARHVLVPDLLFEDSITFGGASDLMSLRAEKELSFVEPYSDYYAGVIRRTISFYKSREDSCSR